MTHAYRPLTISALSVLIAVAGAGSAVAAPATHQSLPADNLVLNCAGGVVYSGIAGTLEVVAKNSVAASGNTSFFGTVTLKDVLVTDGTLQYRASGAAHFGGQTNAHTGSVSDMGVFHIQVVSDHGPIAAVKITARLLDDGTVWMNDHADCSQP